MTKQNLLFKPHVVSRYHQTSKIIVILIRK